MTTPPPASVEAKIVVLGTQGVGKTSLVHRYVKNSFIPPSKAQSTVGASFLTTRVSDAESGTTIRLQIWDTAGQERFRSISKLYYRGAHAAILCYDVTSWSSFEEMGRWLQELREQTNGGLEDMIIHVVGTKIDVVTADPRQRAVTFEQCIEYVAQQLYPPALPPVSRGSSSHAGRRSSAHITMNDSTASPNSNRGSGFWGAEHVWDCCHEVSAKDGEGIDEVFRVITRKLVEQNTIRQEAATALQARGKTPGSEGGQGYFDMPNSNGSFRLGVGDKRRSWLGLSTPGGFTSFAGDESNTQGEETGSAPRARCCG